eukprot:SAG31_NODE_4142_length_3537_cov_15.892088_2_plen_74_part_00
MGDILIQVEIPEGIGPGDEWIIEVDLGAPTMQSSECGQATDFAAAEMTDTPLSPRNERCMQARDNADYYMLLL